MTKVYFVRHAQPDYSNHDDMGRELTEKGLKDTALVTAFLSDRDISHVVSSPFKRAYDTVLGFARSRGLSIEVIEDFRERRIDSVWIDDFNAFSRKQWSDFDYKLTDGESLREVQERNIAALSALIRAHKGQNVAVGSHGTALSTIINYYDPTFGYECFERIRGKMPWIAEFDFDDEYNCVRIETHDLY